MTRTRLRDALSWLFLGALFVLCGALGVLQYRWIDEVSRAERDRLRASLQASLERLSQDFTSEVTSQCRAILPSEQQLDSSQAEAAISSNYVRWRNMARRTQMFRQIALVTSQPEAVVLRSLDLNTGRFAAADWPTEWASLRERLAFRGPPGPWQKGGPTGARPEEPAWAFGVPLFSIPGPPPGPASFARREPQRVIFELDPAYVRDVMLPALLWHHLGDTGSQEYEVAILSRGGSPAVIYESDLGQSDRIVRRADVSAGLFGPQSMQMPLFRGPGGPGGPRDSAMAMGRGPGAGNGRWQVYVHHRAGSLEAVVSRTRWRNLAVTGGVLLLMMASVVALVRYTRRAERFAELQMEFVAGVSHELRTPLTVIHTAAYNLRGKLAGDRAQVEKYGELIQRESGRLTELVEQVLRFAASEAGRSIREREPISVEAVLDEAIEASRTVIESSRCVVERAIDPHLPPVLGDAAALKHVFENLLANAAKHGAGVDRWIGIYAARLNGKDSGAVEVRVSDRGPGIPARERKHLFDPFFRGERALRDQVHGSGLGLNLVKKIVEAHEGSVEVTSEPGKLTEFIVRIPAMPAGQEDEFTHSADRG